MTLQVGDHHAFQQREWTAQRIGWTCMGLFVVAALVGLLGPGPLSWTTATSQDGLVEVEHQRFAHIEADDMITIVVAPAAVTGDSVEIELAEDWVRSVDISTITPTPMEQVATDYGVRLVVSAEPGVQVPIQITFRADELGAIGGAIRMGDRIVAFDQFVYP